MLALWGFIFRKELRENKQKLKKKYSREENVHKTRVEKRHQEGTIFSRAIQENSLMLDLGGRDLKEERDQTSHLSVEGHPRERE